MLFSRKKRDSKPAGQYTTHIQWREPKTAEEHLILFAALAEAITSFDYPYVWVHVDYKWGANITDTVELCFYGADALTVYESTDPGRYIKKLMDEQGNNIIRCSFEFPGSSGAPGYFRTNDSVLKFVRPFAPHAIIDKGMSNMDHTLITFEKHELQYAYSASMITDTIMKHF